MEVDQIQIVDTSQEGAGPGMEVSEGNIVDSTQTGNDGAGSGVVTPPPAEPAQPPAEPSIGDPPAPPPNPVDQFRAGLTEWGKSQGFEITPEELETVTDQGSMNKVVQDKWVNKALAEKPMLKEVYNSGVNLDAYLGRMSELQHLKGVPPRDLYIAQMAKDQFDSEVKLNKIDINDNEASTARQQEITAEITDKLSNVDDLFIEKAVAPFIQQIENEINELPARIKAQQEQFGSQQREALEEKYNQKNTEFLTFAGEELSKTGDVLFNFSGQDTKEGFQTYLKEQTSVTDIENKDANGVVSKTRDIPFMNKLVEDPALRLKVIRFMHMLENGGITDLNNTAREQAVNALGLHPIIKGPSSQSSQSNVVDTSKPYEM